MLNVIPTYDKEYIKDILFDETVFPFIGGTLECTRESFEPGFLNTEYYVAIKDHEPIGMFTFEDIDGLDDTKEIHICFKEKGRGLDVREACKQMCKIADKKKGYNSIIGLIKKEDTHIAALGELFQFKHVKYLESGKVTVNMLRRDRDE